MVAGKVIKATMSVNRKMEKGQLGPLCQRYAIEAISATVFPVYGHGSPGVRLGYGSGRSHVGQNESPGLSR